jgi:recombinational DNA repair ATPase RecF
VRNLEDQFAVVDKKHQAEKSQYEKIISEKNILLDNVGKNDNKFYELKMKNYLDEISTLKIENQKLKDQVNALKKNSPDSKEVTALQAKITTLEQKLAQYEKLADKNSKIKKRGDNESDYTNGNSVFNIQTQKESSQFYHESFQAKKGYDTSSMEKFANSIPNIPDLVKKSPEDLEKL